MPPKVEPPQQEWTGLDRMTRKQIDAYYTQSSGLWAAHYRGEFQPHKRDHFIKGMPHYYGLTLHGTNATGTDPSPRAH